MSALVQRLGLVTCFAILVAIVQGAGRPAGCSCSLGKSGGKCCEFTSRIPQIGSGAAPCHCRQCQPAYYCDGYGRQYCIFKHVDMVARCTGPTFENSGLCVAEKPPTPILVPYTPVSPKRQKTRPDSFNLFFAADAFCEVYHGLGSKNRLFRAISFPRVYSKTSLPLKNCLPIRVRCIAMLADTMGVMVAIQGAGESFGSGIGDTCTASSRQPRNWNSNTPESIHEEELITDGLSRFSTWSKLSALTGTKPIRPSKNRDQTSYFTLTPPFCGDDYI